MDKVREKKLALSFLNTMSAEDIKRIWNTDLSWDSLEIFLGKDRMELFENELKWESDNSIGEHGYIFIDEDDYPISLKSHSDAPYRIAYKGCKPIGCSGEFNRYEAITVVGTRKCSSEAIKASFSLSCEASSAGLVVYSGYADGIDKASHYGVLSRRGKTFAVLASGLDNDYAKRRPKLEDMILSNGGGLLSQFYATSDPYKSHFYFRNRLLATISDATFVIQAPLHSGSLITASCALEKGKSVFVHTVGLKNIEVNEGTIKLKSDGAKEISSYSMLSENYPEFPKGQIALPIKKNKIAEIKVSENAKKIVGYNGEYFALM